MPVMSARSFAEMINMPMYEQVRILEEQKYPARVPHVFKIPYYRPALDAIKRYYRNNRDAQLLATAIAHIRQRIRTPSKMRHNIRVIQRFRSSAQSRRLLMPVGQKSFSASIMPDVTLRLYFDLEAQEKNRAVRIFYNFRDVPITRKIAIDTINVAYWVLRANNVACNIGQIEYVDFKANEIYKARQPSAKISRSIAKYAQVVKSIWNAI